MENDTNVNDNTPGGATITPVVSVPDSPGGWGARPQDWEHLCRLGLTTDQLPVVSKIGATVSPNSKLQDLCKVPSLYNYQGHVIGMTGWTQRVATERDIAVWSANPDYGICLQTRQVRAFDIDVPEWEHADKIEAVIRKMIPNGNALPCRSRSNSGKRLLAFTLKGEMTKRRMPTATGVIELLANGQQFIAYGTHPSGVRYQWDVENPEFPDITPEDVERIWSALDMLFATGEPTQSRGLRRRGENIDTPDPVLEHLLDKWPNFGFGTDDQLFIECPYKDEHTSDSGPTATAWLRAGTKGYERGAFSCLHAHCAGRTRGEFESAVGYLNVGFECLPVPQTQITIPVFERDKDDAILPSLANTVLALGCEDVIGCRIARDSFKDNKVLAAGDEDWRPITDRDPIALRLRLTKCGFKPVNRETIADAIEYVAGSNEFDSAFQWLNGLTWDGVSRCETLFSTYFGAQDTPYTRAVSLYLTSAMAGRVLSPGIQADMVPILVGAQGLGKSTGIKSLCPNEETYAEMSFGEDPKDLSRKLRGRLVVEISELRGMRTRDIETIKAFVTKTHEDWTPKFKEYNTQFARRCIFIGTTNDQEFLADATGNRRWLPVRVGQIDRDAIRRDCLQIWAEAKTRFEAHDILYADAQKLAEREHEAFTVTDAWEELIGEWLDRPELGGKTPRQRGGFTSVDALAGGVGMARSAIKPVDTSKVVKILTRLGFEQRARVSSAGGPRARRWYAAEPMIDTANPSVSMGVSTSVSTQNLAA